ncbi:MAG: matrixin family metalloprotease [Thermoproteota archaeon]
MSEIRKLASAVLISALFLPMFFAFATAPPPEKIVFVHYKMGAGKPSTDKGYYKLLGAKWKVLPVTYVIDPDNPYGLSDMFVVNSVVASAEEWDFHTSAELFSSYSIVYDASWDDDAPDGRNEIVFGDYKEANVIAVTVIWGYFSGRNKQIVEFDVLFDVDFTWGDAAEDPTKMDLRNIATHELGHGVGLGDLYNPAAWRETMYGYSDYGETIKRDLYVGDISGIQKLYGE